MCFIISSYAIVKNVSIESSPRIEVRRRRCGRDVFPHNIYKIFPPQKRKLKQNRKIRICCHHYRKSFCLCSKLWERWDELKRGNQKRNQYYTTRIIQTYYQKKKKITYVCFVCRIVFLLFFLYFVNTIYLILQRNQNTIKIFNILCPIQFSGCFVCDAAAGFSFAATHGERK